MIGKAKVATYIFSIAVFFIAILIAIFSTIGMVDITGLAISFLLATGSVILFITARSRGNPNPADKNEFRLFSNSFFTTRSDAKNITLATGIVCYLLAFLSVIGSITPSTTGRWAWLWNNLNDWFGPHGFVVFQLTIGTLFIITTTMKKK